MSNRTHTTRLSVVAIAATTIAAALTAAAPAARADISTYTISGMGIPDYPVGGTYNGVGSAAYSISNTGYVAGGLQGTNGYTHPFEYRNGTLTQLPTLGGRGGAADAVNDAGQAAGTSRPAGSTPTDVAPLTVTIWTKGVPQSLGTLGGASANANGINDAGQVAGSAIVSTGATTAFRSNNGVLSALGTLGGPDSYGGGINGAGVIAGAADVPGAAADFSGPYQACYWDASGDIHAIPNFGGLYSSAYNVNAAGTITGYNDYAGDSDQRAFLYTASGTLTNLGYADAAYPETQGQGINDLGQVVGWGYTTDYSDERAFVYSDGQMYDLNDLTGASGWTLQYAYGINDDGDIVGEGIDPAGYEHAFLLTPTGVMVPEPASLSAAGLAAAGLLGRRRRRHSTVG